LTPPGAHFDKSLVAADSCFKTWRHKSYANRAAIVNKAATLMRAQVDDFARFATRGMANGIDEARGKRIASQVDTGMAFASNIDRSDADLPSGGIKGCGYGHEMGYLGTRCS